MISWTGKLTYSRSFTLNSVVIFLSLRGYVEIKVTVSSVYLKCFQLTLVTFQEALLTVKNARVFVSLILLFVYYGIKCQYFVL